MPTRIEREIERIARKFGIQIMYAFGSRAEEAADFVEGKIAAFEKSASDLDIGVKVRRKLGVFEKVELATALEDLFGVERVDLVLLDEAPTFLAVKIVFGRLLYAENSTFEAEYQLYILRKASELAHYQKEKIRMAFEKEGR